MIGEVNPFLPPEPMAPLPPPPPPPGSKGGLSLNTINSIQKGFEAEGVGQTKPPATPKGTVQGMQLKPGWGGGA